MLLVAFTGAFEPTFLTDQLRFHAFVHNMRHMFVYAFVEFAVPAVVNASRLLNAAFASVIKSLIEGIFFATVIFIASNRDAVHFFLLVVAKFSSLKNLATVRNRAFSALL